MHEPLTEIEIASLREFLIVAEQVKAEAEYRAAVRLVIRTWRGIVISFAGIIGALIILRANAKSVLEWVLQ